MVKIALSKCGQKCFACTVSSTLCCRLPSGQWGAGPNQPAGISGPHGRENGLLTVMDSVRTVSEGGPPLAWGPQTLPLKGDPTFYISGGELRSFKPFFLLERRVWHYCLGSTGQASWGAQGWCQVCRTLRQPGQCRLKPDFHSKGDPSAGKRCAH